MAHNYISCCVDLFPSHFSRVDSGNRGGGVGDCDDRDLYRGFSALHT